MTRGRSTVALACVAMAFVTASASLAAAPTPDPGAVRAVTRYVAALAKQDYAAAYALLTTAQQRYFRNARNFASNYATTQYRIASYAVSSASMHNPSLVQVDVAQTTSFYDFENARTTTVRGTEPYFALRTDGAWGVKELYVPWKSYAPNAKGDAAGLTVIVDRVEFFTSRVQVDCTLRNLGIKPVQVLPLLRSTLRVGTASLAAMNTTDFPLNDQPFFEGARIYPLHQLVGYINFPYAAHADQELSMTLAVGPIVADGAPGPASATVGPMRLAKW